MGANLPRVMLTETLNDFCIQLRDGSTDEDVVKECLRENGMACYVAAARDHQNWAWAREYPDIVIIKVPSIDMSGQKIVKQRLVETLEKLKLC